MIDETDALRECLKHVEVNDDRFSLLMEYPDGDLEVVAGMVEDAEMEMVFESDDPDCTFEPW